MYFQKGEYRLYFSKVGQGPSLVLLHGWGQDSSSFWNVVDALSKNHTLYLIDLPGFGRSNLPKDNLRISDYADIVAEFLKDQKLAKPVLLGHSLGGRVAIKLAAKYPHLISKLILEDSAGLKAKPTLKSKIFFLIAKIIKYLIPDMFGLKTYLRYKFYRGIGSDYLDAGDKRKTFLNIINEDLSSDLGKIKNETLILWGENDREVPLNVGKAMYKRIDKARIEMLENIGHFPHLENPNLFNYYVKDFA